MQTTFRSREKVKLQNIILKPFYFKHFFPSQFCSVCLDELKQKANVEYDRLVNKLPKKKQEKFNGDIAQCLKNNGN